MVVILKMELMMMREWKLLRFAVGGREVDDMAFLFTD